MGNFAQNHVKLDIFGTFLVKKGVNPKISGGSPALTIPVPRLLLDQAEQARLEETGWNPKAV